jgi:hypothetical protein
LSAGEEAEFEAILKHLEAVVTDLEQIHSLKQMGEEAKLDVVELLQAVMGYSDIDSVGVPASVHGELVGSGEGKADTVELSQSGVVLVKRKGGENKATHLAEYKPAVIIKVLNALIPILKDEIAERRKIHEKNLEALQSIKQSLSSVEKRRRPSK